MTFVTKAMRTALAGVVAAGIGGAAMAQEVTLKMHQFLPPQANVPKLILQPWADRIMEASDGRIKIDHYPAMQLGGKPPELASQVTDGACWMILASDDALKAHGLEPIATIQDSEWAALDPRVMGLGPVLSSAPLLERAKLGLDDIDLWELNEAFAAQVLACLEAFASDDFCRAVLGQDGALGTIDRAKLNVDGGAISLGHPVGTSGARIVLHLINALRRTGGKRGIATECIGGGQGGAMLVELAQ